MWILYAQRLGCQGAHFSKGNTYKSFTLIYFSEATVLAQRWLPMQMDLANRG